MPIGFRADPWFRQLDVRNFAQEFAVDIEEAPYRYYKRGEELFQLILSGIREVFDCEDAIIAGGAVRDVAAGISDHKDVDVFIPMKWPTFRAGAMELGWQGLPRRIDNVYKPKTKGVGCLFDTNARASAMIQNVQIDLIFMDRPLTQENVDTFPIHAQRCIWTLNEGIELSPEALKDKLNKTFTIDPTITDKDKIEYLVAKIEGWQKRKVGYEKWSIVRPEVREWWEAKNDEENKVAP